MGPDVQIFAQSFYGLILVKGAKLIYVPCAGAGKCSLKYIDLLNLRCVRRVIAAIGKFLGIYHRQNKNKRLIRWYSLFNIRISSKIRDIPMENSFY